MFRSKPLLSEDAIQRLGALEKTLAALKNPQPFGENGSSAYSQQMIENLVTVIQRLIKNNQVSYWEKDAHRDDIVTLLDYLDASKGTNCPDVFNEQSLAVAEICLKFIKQFDLKKDVVGGGLLSAAVGDLNHIRDTLISNLAFKIEFYQRCKEMNEQEKEKNVLLNEFSKLCDAVEKSSAEELPQAIALYKQTVPLLFNRAKQIAYVRFANVSDFVNKKQPYTISDETEILRVGGMVIKGLLAGETWVNKILHAKGQPALNTVFNLSKSLYCEADLQSKYVELRKIFTALQQEAKVYLSGEHFTGVAGLFKSVDKGKKLILEKALLDLNPLINNPINEEDQSLRFRSFAAYKVLIAAARDNEKIAQDKKIALGELAKLVNRHALQFMRLAFSITEREDKNIQDSVDRYRKDNNLLENDALRLKF